MLLFRLKQDFVKLNKKQTYIVSSIFLLFVFYLIKEAISGGDLDYYLYVSERLLKGENIYIPNNDLKFNYIYGIIFTFILVPFTYLPNFILNFVFLFLTLYWSLGIWKLIIDYLDINNFNKKEINYLIFFSFLLIFRALLYNFGMQQLTVLLLFAILYSLILIHKGKYIKASILISIVTAIKIIPIVFLPYLIYRKEFKASIYFVLFTILFLFFVPVLFLGLDKTLLFLDTWINVLIPSSDIIRPTAKEIGRGAHDLNVWLLTLLSETKGNFTYTRNIISLSYEQTQIIVNLVRFFLISLTLYFLNTKPFQKAKNKINILWEISYITLIIPLIFPVQQKYAFYFLYPSCVYLVWFVIFYYKKLSYMNLKLKVIISLLIISFILSTISSDLFIGRHYSQLAHYYKLITYGTIILIPALIIANPSIKIIKT